MKKYLTHLTIGGLCFGLLGTALASVTQVDGVIVPVGNALQNALDAEEGVSTGPTSIDAVLDAFLVPEIFKPDTTKLVTIKDIAEGAGFENTFGYYNVGDDITCGNGGTNGEQVVGTGCANLHPILGCTVNTIAGAGNATNHGSGVGGDAAGGYTRNAEPGTIASVNFAVEQAQGRYKGGFIGFYLITPEANPSNNNDACGDNKLGSDNRSLFGKIYFTQRDLNNDGDFVHTLIYNSKIVSDRFYFGAEDLFRGGDNDYEDMATQVNGLTPPCVPVAETCNGDDDDCDGVVDNNPSDVGDGCVDGVGSCQVEGATVCVSGVEVCGAIPNGPTQELCNGADDDCDGVVDNAAADVGDACSVGDGSCERAGVTVCSGGFEICGAAPGSPAGETCNSLDDDCDGLTDEDFGVGDACEGIGECGPGQRECSSVNSTRCSTDVGGSEDESSGEVCDGLDNDCDGSVDDSVAVGGACTVGVGSCQRTGSLICAGGGVICNASAGSPVGETCNGLDDDCDGLSDEDFNLGQSCDGVGACGLGVTECSTATATRCSTDVGGSQNQATGEVCDGLDNDCDGNIDESADVAANEPTIGQACGGGAVNGGASQCRQGSNACSAGQIRCVGSLGPTAEFCDNKDNDCDGVTDDNPIGQGQSCGSDVGECSAGQQQCQAGAFLCVGATNGVGETCNSLDDDCDGLTDEDFGVGNACEGIGACGPGLLECRSLSASGCSTDVGGSQDQSTSELCNGQDDDCDGNIDDATTDIGLACTAGLGVCQAAGTTICAGGGAVCNATPGLPSAEVCDGLDNDCDGIIDNGFNVGLACDGIGECGPGVLECATATSTQCSTDAGGSQSQVQPESCDSLDNDCDGTIDDGLNDLGDCGLFPDVGECLDGRLRCSVGQIECVGELGPTAEFCDGLDNDCDGVNDNDVIDDEGPCGSNFGECQQGTEVCFGGALLCSGETPPTTERCDALDNDCDGINDNNLNDPLVNQPCGVDTGECDPGSTICSAGQVLCFGGNGPQAEVCDGLDNDCDNLVDGSDTSPADGIIDGIDLDGDGIADITTADAGQLCGNNSSTNPQCSAGLTVCQPDPNDANGDGFLGELVCEGGNAGVVELCNGIDDDCDNAIDDSPEDPELGLACGNDFGACVPGTNRCSAGQIICDGGVGPSFEICNGIDDDCDCPNEDTNKDGVICGVGDFNVDETDDQPLCGDPAQCVLGDCRLPCDLKEARCAGGEICFDDNEDGFGFCIPDPCLGVNCTAPDVCSPFTGDCALPCEISPCIEGFVCDATSGECLENNCYGLGCPDEQLCLDATCVPDPCVGVSCGAEEFCREGQCVKSCEAVACPPQQKCSDGGCVADLCFGVSCDSNEQCVSGTGLCSNLCRNVDCGEGRVCDPADGSCLDDPCTGVVCADSAVCSAGQCVSTNGQPGFLTGGGAGCSVDPEQDSSGYLALCLLVLLAAASRVAKRRSVLLSLFFFLQGCVLDPFFFLDGEQCETTQNGLEICDLVDNNCNGIIDENCTGCLPTNGGIEDCDNIDNNCNGIVDEDCQNQGCVPSNNGVEKCDEADNDCDSFIDEGFDLTSDFRNCGACNRACNIAGAFSSCEPDPQDTDGNGFLGECVFDGCAPGNVDLDGNPATGCEYECTVTNGGAEACDDIDNDCDGLIDEDFDFANDDNNCGGCGNVCAFFQATPTCSQSQCVFDPANDCLVVTDPATGQQTAFHDVDGNPATGCEYPCNPNPADADPTAPESLCNGLDDDCDGLRDDGLNLDADPNNCGRCGRVCTFPNVANPSCEVGDCSFDPATDCNVGTHDIDGNPLNGCEYPCLISNNGVEVCDGLDNDCDGQADEVAEVTANDAAIGQACGAANVGTCQAGATVCVAGAPACVGAIGPRNEVCDGQDNDCDGATDELSDLTDVGRVCANAIGECSLGLTACTVGVLVCEQQQGPAPEVCDGLDNDCDGLEDGTDTNGDGVADQLPQDAAQPCGGGAFNGGDSQCQEGVTVCSLGTLQCAGSVDPSAEICDSVDNDCDGQVDVNAAQVGLACGSNIGECNQGTFVCSAGVLDCQNDTGPANELCDGLDNDCSGIPDDNILVANDPRIGASCGSTSVGSCELGAQICSGGSIACVGAIEPVLEGCDGQDNDCNGQSDNDPNTGLPLSQACYDGPSGTQNLGVCRGGSRICGAGSFSGCLGQVLPAAEVCNGLDDDCDGQVDEASDLVDVGQVCANAIGECSLGLSVCQAGVLSCEQQQGPAAEVCDGLDNDCDGLIDGTDLNGDGSLDLLPGDVAQDCGGGAVNVGASQCRRGTTVCSVGVLSCSGNVDPSAEVCDGVDNNCDGQVDVNAAQVGLACGSNIGECNQGTFVCSAGVLDCQNDTGPANELCDGLDNDCSGIPDDNILTANDPRIGASCGATAAGACELGTQLCVGGAVACVGAIGPISESCNTIDDDCDGAADENAVNNPLAQACYNGPNGTNGVGRCQGGLQNCVGGAFSGACVGEVLPATESCNTIDDDCDGAADEANGGGPLKQACYSGPGGTQNVGICAGGLQTCSAGSFSGACVGEVLPESEICGDNLNNDCDANATDSSEGCIAGNGNEIRLDAANAGGTASNPGVNHSIDADIASAGANVYAVFADNRNSGRLRIMLARSTNGGATFPGDLVEVTTQSDVSATSPQVLAFRNTSPNAGSTNDTVIVAWVQLRTNQTRDIFVAVSRDSGASFAGSRTFRLDADDNTKDAFHFDLAGIKTSNNVKLAVAWEELDTTNLSRVVKVRRSKNAESGTMTFDAGEQTANKGTGNQIAGRPKVVFGNSDRIIAVWREQRSGAGFNGTTDIFSNFWNDGNTDINATDRRLDTDTGADSDDFPVMARLGTEIYVAWHDIKIDGSDITFVRSSNNGTAFGSQLVLDDPSVEVSSSLFPAIFAQTIGGENRVYVAWADDRDGSEIFVARSTNGGISFTGGLRASSIENPVPGVSLDPQILADAAGRVYVSFSSDRSGFEDVFVGFSLDDGAFFQPLDVRADQNAAGAAPSIFPRMTLLSSGVGVIWQDFRGAGTVSANGDIYFRRVTP